MATVLRGGLLGSSTEKGEKVNHHGEEKVGRESLPEWPASVW